MRFLAGTLLVAFACSSTLCTPAGGSSRYPARLGVDENFLAEHDSNFAMQHLHLTDDPDWYLNTALDAPYYEFQDTGNDVGNYFSTYQDQGAGVSRFAHYEQERVPSITHSQDTGSYPPHLNHHVRYEYRTSKAQGRLPLQQAPYTLQFRDPQADTNDWYSRLQKGACGPHYKVGQSSVIPIDEAEEEEMVDVPWFAGKMSSKEYKAILSNLAKYWSITKKLAALRLKDYVNRVGLVTSPEPLFKYGTADFQQAADIIFTESRGRRKLYIKSDLIHGGTDILHKASSRYDTSEGPPQFIEYSDRPIKVNARFYHSHQWHENLKPEEIKVIHAAVVHHWVPWFDIKSMSKRLNKVNDFLEKHPDSLERIKKGDVDAAYEVAFVTVGCKEDKMRSYYLDGTKGHVGTSDDRLN